MEHASEAAVVPSYGGRVLILRRPEEGRWAGLWEFPRGACHAGETPLRAGRRVLREVIGLQGRIGPAIGVLVYGVTKFRIEMVCLRADCSTNAFRVTRHVEGRWVHPHELIQLPLAAPQRRLAQLLI